MPLSNRPAHLQTLLQSGWLASQPEALRTRIIERIRLELFAPGATIYAVGDTPGGVYGLVSGTLAVSIAPSASGPHVAHLAQPGSWFGEGSFLTRNPRRIGLEAVTTCILAHLPLGDMERLVGNDTEVMRAFGQIAMFNIDLALSAVADLLIKDPARRVAAVLWRSSGGQSGRAIPMTQAQLGQLANASRKHTLATLRKLVDESAIEQGYRAITILAPERLRRLADGDPD